MDTLQIVLKKSKTSQLLKQEYLMGLSCWILMIGWNVWRKLLGSFFCLALLTDQFPTFSLSLPEFPSTSGPYSIFVSKNKNIFRTVFIFWFIWLGWMVGRCWTIFRVFWLKYLVQFQIYSIQHFNQLRRPFHRLVWYGVMQFVIGSGIIFSKQERSFSEAD